MPDYLDCDLHGLLPEGPPVRQRLEDRARQARQRHLGLRIIHGRGAHVLASIAQAWLADHGLAFQEGYLNPGETRVEAVSLQRAKFL
ncbi:MAG: Smr/MutS family protein [Terriglobales bacterium]